MHVGQQRSGQPDPVAGARAMPPLRQPRRRTGPGGSRPVVRRWRAAAWIGGGLALVVLVTRISMTGQVNSDGASIALQGWDMLHGRLLLPGWITADASYYTFEVPQLSIAELCFGLTSLACHVVSALSYVVVAALAVALARTNSHGAAAAARGAAVLAVLAAPVVTGPGVAILLEAPQHIGTSAYLLGCFLLIDRAPGSRFTAPLVGLILFAGQVGDTTVRYVAVPAVLVVCAYRVLADRRIRTPDTAIAVAAAVSVPLAAAARAVMRHFGAFAMVPPRTAISPAGLWWHHMVITWQDVRTLFGAAVASPGTALDAAAAAFGWACLLAVVFGFAKVVWTWRTASRGEQLPAVAIVVNLGVYAVSTMATTVSAREIAAVLPCGAVLAARACVPGRIAGPARAGTVAGVAALAALLPLAVAAAQPVSTPAAVPLAAWLRAHGFSYGIAGYWDASAVTVQSGNQVLIRAITVKPGRFAPFYWETRPDWYSPSRHDATFVIADTPRAYPNDNFTAAAAERYFGRPVAIYQVAGRWILRYRMNLLRRLAVPFVPSPTGKTE